MRRIQGFFVRKHDSVLRIHDFFVRKHDSVFRIHDFFVRNHENREQISLCSENRLIESSAILNQLLGGGQITITTTITSAGYGGSEKSKTSNERRTHSPALLRRPTIYVVGINMAPPRPPTPKIQKSQQMTKTKNKNQNI